MIKHKLAWLLNPGKSARERERAQLARSLAQLESWLQAEVAWVRELTQSALTIRDWRDLVYLEDCAAILRENRREYQFLICGLLGRAADLTGPGRHLRELEDASRVFGFYLAQTKNLFGLQSTCACTPAGKCACRQAP